VALTPSRIVLDTSAFTRLRGADARVASAVAAASSVYLSVVTLGELEAGAQLGVRPADNRAALSEFLSAPFVSVLPINPDVARVYGRLFAELRRAGTPIGVNDIWIAASAIEAGAHLITLDADFARIRGLDATILPVELT
jgi:tRNA(fMet)-specific endonuclease VapC